MMASLTTTQPSVLDRAPSSLQDFVTRMNLLAALEEAIAIALSVFDISEPLSLAIEEDPDTGESWVEINLSARGGVNAVMRAHAIYIERSLALATSTAGQIRLFLRVAEA